MGRSQETYNKKEVRKNKEKKRKDKEKSRLARKDEKKGSPDDMIAYVDENGMISSTPPDPDKKTAVKLEDITIGVARREVEDEPDPVRKGTVTYFNESKGYGFIRDAETKDSVFVHVNNVLETITEGNLVTYEVEMGHKGPTAISVKIFK